MRDIPVLTIETIKRMEDINAGLIEMSEEEKEAWRQKLFGNLEDMQKSFEATHK